MHLTEIDESLHGPCPSFLCFVDRLYCVALFKILTFVVTKHAIVRQKDGVIADPLKLEIFDHFRPDIVVAFNIFFTFSRKEPALPHDSVLHICQPLMIS